MRLYFLLACILCFSCALSSIPALASPAAATTAQPAQVEQQASTQALQSYVQPSYINLARSLWALNAHSLTNDLAVDDFLMISECGLYKRFYNNEFEWKKIREATRDYLSKNKNTFPRHFEYIQPLMLDRYDFSLKGFRLMPGSVFVSSDRLEMAKNLKSEVACKGMSYGYIDGYPSDMMIILKQPFKLDFVRVNEDLAQEYLKIISEREIRLNEGRPAYIRFRVRFDRYLGDNEVGQHEYAIFGGVLETIEVFADRDLMFKLYEQAFY
jgi:hypothetical protein